MQQKNSISEIRNYYSIITRIRSNVHSRYGSLSDTWSHDQKQPTHYEYIQRRLRHLQSTGVAELQNYDRQETNAGNN